MTRAAIAAAALAAASTPALAAPEGPFVARVNEVAISSARFERFFEDDLAEKGRHAAAITSPAVYKQLRREALDTLIARELLRQSAEKNGVSVPEAEVEREVAATARQFKTREAFLARLARGGFDERSYREWTRDEIRIRRYLAEHALPPPRILDRAAIREHVDSLRAEATVEISPAFRRSAGGVEAGR